MVATISPVDSQYHHTLNTLKYADRAKKIKTHVQVKLVYSFRFPVNKDCSQSLKGSIFCVDLFTSLNLTPCD